MLSKAKKFNKGFDVLKVQAEVLSKMNQKSFESHLKASKQFLSIVYNDLPLDLIDYLDSPTEFKLVKFFETAEKSSEPVSLPSTEKSFLREVPPHVKPLLQFDCMVQHIPLKNRLA